MLRHACKNLLLWFSFFLYHIHGAFYTYERLGIIAIALYMGVV